MPQILFILILDLRFETIIDCIQILSVSCISVFLVLYANVGII